MRLLPIFGLAVVALFAVAAGALIYFQYFANPRVTRELVENPRGKRADRVMLLTLPSERTLPVNYLREGDVVYAAADGLWWRELRDAVPVALLVQGEALTGTARAVRDDPERTKDVFGRLRPNAIEGFGTLIEIRLDPVDPGP